MATDLEGEVWSAISAFEQILEAMPDDRSSLEALSHAYEQIGDHVKAKEYLIRLGNVLLDEADLPAAAMLLERLGQYGPDDADVQELTGRIQQAVPDAPVTESESVAGETADETAETPVVVEAEATPKVALSVRSAFNMADELSFAWNLMEAGEINQEEYASVVQDLTELSAGEIASTVSVLHVLEHRSFPGLEKIVGFVAKDCETPIIAISSFDLQADTVTLLPLDFIVQRGVLAFETVGNSVLVVVMNPYDTQLQKDVEAALGKKCHFFVTIPQEFDQAVEKVKDIMADAAAQ